MILFTSGLLFLFLPGGPEKTGQTIPVLNEPDLAVHVLIKHRPSLADRDWLTITFANHGTTPIAFEAAHYSIDCVARGRQDPKWQMGMVLSSGQSRELFPRKVKSGIGPAFTLYPGQTYRVSEHASDFGAAALGLPPDGGLDVSCTMRMFMRLTNGQVFQTPEGNLKFSFEWTQPDEASLKAVRARLKEMLKEPVDEMHYHYLLGTFLRTEEIVTAVSRDDLLAALKGRNSRTDGRTHIVQALLKQHNARKEMLEYYGDRIKGGYYDTLEEIPRLGLWSPSYIPGVVKFYGPHPSIDPQVLEILHQHRDDWLKNKDEVANLMAQIKKKHPVLDKNPKTLNGKELAEWARAVGELALVADRSAVEMLRSGLEDKRVWWRPDPRAAFSAQPPPLIRVCDTASAAITAILDGKMENRQLLGLAASVRDSFNKKNAADFVAERDAQIEGLQKRLAALDKGEK